MKINGKDYRTIWPKPGNPQVIQIIDQRHLPHGFVVEDLKNTQDFARAIKEMHVRGAGLIGAAAGFGFYSAMLDLSEKGYKEELEKRARELLETRPTARNLGWAIERQFKEIKKGNSLSEKKEIAFQTAVEIADEDAKACYQIGEHGLQIIKKIAEKKKSDVVNILTHCNAGWLAFVDFGSATSPIYMAHKEGIDIHVWVDETRPWLQGAKLTAWELREENVPHTLIADNTGGYLMQKGMVDLVIVGTDRTTRTGDVANKIGTYLKALAAKDCNIPFYVALPSSTFDWALRDGILEIPIEERSQDEVKYVSGLNPSGNPETVLISNGDVRARNYGFDITPARLISGLITERGVTNASEEAILELFPEHR